MVADVPPAVVTVTSTVPAGFAGEVAVIEVEESDVTEAGVEPKSTTEAKARFVPVIVTVVPPAVVALDGLTALTVGVPSKL